MCERMDGATGCTMAGAGCPPRGAGRLLPRRRSRRGSGAGSSPELGGFAEPQSRALCPSPCATGCGTALLGPGAGSGRLPGVLPHLPLLWPAVSRDWQSAQPAALLRPDGLSPGVWERWKNAFHRVLTSYHFKLPSAADLS